MLILLVLASVGCGRDGGSKNAAQAYGLVETYAFRDEVEHAIIVADLVLDPDVPFRFVATWPNSRLYPELRVTQGGTAHPLAFRRHADGGLTYEFAGYRQIPVNVVDGDGDLGRRETTFVPPDARCVFVNARALPTLLDGFGVVAPSAWQRYSTGERAAAIAVVLLHEAGHIVAGDGGSHGGIGDDRVVNPSTATVRREVAADRFATTQIARGFHPTEAGGPCPARFVASARTCPNRCGCGHGKKAHAKGGKCKEFYLCGLPDSERRADEHLHDALDSQGLWRCLCGLRVGDRDRATRPWLGHIRTSTQGHGYEA